VESLYTLHLVVLSRLLLFLVIRLAIVCIALRGASPEQVPAILQALPGIFRGAWMLGPLSRKNPDQTADENVKGQLDFPLGGQLISLLADSLCPWPRSADLLLI
jgi:hypothetical protein